MAYLPLDEAGNPLTPERLRKRGLCRERNAHVAASFGEDPEPELRLALGDLVNAFLFDRVSQSDLFARAHRLGQDLSRVGCFYEYNADDSSYRLNCPIFALHQVTAFSVSMTVLTECSVCGAGALQCEHVDGREYDGEFCQMNAVKILSFGHVAFTANPDFIYTWHQPRVLSLEEALATGKIQVGGDPLPCHHCANCRGKVGPDPDDLDPVGRFNRLLKDDFDLK
ncbi:MAG: hypothetical protein JJE13_08980 [Thermoleophilia bacterium]|nr:hypothetical protein [Thermoleophilia bacterium]